MELDPEVFPGYGNVPLISLIYSYMRMGLPVLLVVKIDGVGHHALTLVGYSLEKENHNICGLNELGPPLPMVGLRIGKFYVHDDQYGPFSRLLIQPASKDEDLTFPVTFTGSWINPLTGKACSIYPIAAIVPVYNKIRLKFLDIKIPLARLNSFLTTNVIGRVEKLEWDVHLITTNDYKEEIKKQEIYKKLENLLLAPHPKYIWRTIFKINDKSVLELLADATDVKLECPFYKMTIFEPSLESILKSLFNLDSLNPTLTDLLTEPFHSFLKDQLNFSRS